MHLPRPRLRVGCLVLVVLLVAVRAVLPLVVEGWAERTIDRAPEHEASIGDVDLNLWRGAYEIEAIDVWREVDGGKEPLLVVPRLDLSVRWSQLVRGRVDAEAILYRPDVLAVSHPADPDAPAEGTPSLAERLEALAPFELRRFVVREGVFRFQYPSADPPIDIVVEDVWLEGWNFTNRPREDGTTTTVEIAGRPLGMGELECRIAVDPLEAEPRFELDVEVRDVDVRELNDLLLAYVGVDAESGTLALSAELAAQDGRYEGYVKVLFTDLSVASYGEIDDPGDALAAFWERIVAAGAEILENQPRDRLAAKVPVEGDFAGVEVDVLGSIASLLGNAFVQALRPGIDTAPQEGDLETAGRKE